MSTVAEQAWQAYQNAECLITEQQIQQALEKMAGEITEVLADKDPLALCVMNGGLFTAGHLLTRCLFPLELDYIHATRYGNTTQGSELEWIARPKTSLQGRTVLIIDDIHDVGETLKAIIDHCYREGAEKVYSAVLVNKIHDRKVDLKADFIGMDVEDKYIFGCGMDYKGYLRNLPAIYAITE